MNEIAITDKIPQTLLNFGKVSFDKYQTIGSAMEDNKNIVIGVSVPCLDT